MNRSGKKRLLEATEKYVKRILKQADSGHDWHHINRVRTMAIRIGTEEDANLFLIELMALLHEAADYKIVGIGNERKAYERLQQFLKKQKVTPEDIDHIMYVIQHQSYSVSGLSGKKLPSLEGQVVQDADRLDALGAIGIARCFTYTGKVGRTMHDPSHTINTKLSLKNYRAYQSTAINHFYEKLFKLTNLMNTKTAKRIAQRRHQFMERYLQQFLDEWDGKK